MKRRPTELGAEGKKDTGMLKYIRNQVTNTWPHTWQTRYPTPGGHTPVRPGNQHLVSHLADQVTNTWPQTWQTR